MMVGRGEDKTDVSAYVKKRLYRHLAFLQWAPKYCLMDFISDLIAGITLGLTMVPQSIAYASLAGVLPKIGLNSAFAGGFLYMLLGTIKQVSIGPTSLMALLTYEYIKDVPKEFTYDYLCLLTFLCGVGEFLMGIFRLGFLVDIISTPVISGFTSASAIIIILSQMSPILGTSHGSHSIEQAVVQFFDDIHLIKVPDTLLGVMCIAFLLGLRKLKDVDVGEKKLLKKALWFVSVGRNAITVILCCVLTFAWEKYRCEVPFALTENVPGGLPTVQMPSFGMVRGNKTITFVEMVHNLRSGIFVIPIVAVLINVSIARTFATGGKIDVTQEMFALSICNIFASFCQSMPICGAFTRSAVSNASGVRTPFSNFYSGPIFQSLYLRLYLSNKVLLGGVSWPYKITALSAVITMLALTFLTPYFRYIPKATLGAVLVAAVIFLMDFQILYRLWKSCRRDLFILLLTIVCCLYFGVEIGLLIGVLANLCFLIYLWARPKIKRETCKGDFGEYIVVTPDLGLFYPAVPKLRKVLTKVAEKNAKKMPIAVNCAYFKGMDYTSIQGLSMVAQDFEKRKQTIVFFNATDEILKVNKYSGMKNLIFCPYNESLDNYLFGDQAVSKNGNCRHMGIELQDLDHQTESLLSQVRIES